MRSSIYPILVMSFLARHPLAAEPSLTDVTTLETARKKIILWQSGMKPFKSVRQWRAELADKRTSLFPWDDYYAQRGTAFSGEMSLDISTGLISAKIRVDGKIIGEGHKAQYFLTFLPVTSVTDSSGQPVPFESTSYNGYSLTKILLNESPPDQAPFSYVFSMEGIPECEYSSAFTVNLCGFGDITYVAMDLVLPGSLMGDFATLDLKVIVPEGLSVASSGITVSVSPAEAPGYEVHHIVQPFPTETHSLVVSKFQVSKIPFGEKWVGTFTKPDAIIATVVPTVLVNLRDVLNFYSERFGDFLFAKLEAAQVTDDAGAAFGWPGLLWVPTMMFLFGTGGFGEDERTALFAHEVGHQWFPGILKNNDAWAPWLSEGFAEFLSVYFMSKLEGESYLQGTFDSYGVLYRYLVPKDKDFALTSKETQWVSDALAYQIVTYLKGAVVANMFRKVLGEAAFLRAMGKLYDDFAGKEAWYDTHILRTYLEKEYGSSLGWLFDAWVYDKGYPIYTVRVDKVATADGESRLRVWVKRESSRPGAVFSLPITFAVVTQEGEEMHTEWVDADEETFEWPYQGRFIRLRFDPERIFIKRLVAALPGDMDLSGEIDGIDLLYTAWAQGGRIGQTYNFLSAVDFDADGAVGDKELDTVISSFGLTSEALQ